MAGIGFELRKLLQRDTLTSLLRAYAYAGVISSGPWVLSILGMVLIGVVSVGSMGGDAAIVRFQVTVTHLIAGSLILTGFAQLALTRFIADRTFERRQDLIIANYHAVLAVTVALCGAAAIAVAVLLFPSQSIPYRVLGVAAATVLSGIWIATVFLSGIKQYEAIVWLYLLGYGVSVGAALALRPWGLEGLLGGFVIGQVLLFVGMNAIILRNYPLPRGMGFEAFDVRLRYPTLMWIGFFYNLGIWIDKFMFWYWPPTSQPVIGPLRASVIYDLPVFMAYLSIIPGMAVFLVRIETDFVEHYDGFYTGVRTGASLDLLERHRNGMLAAVRNGVFEIIKIQAIAILLLFVAGERLLAWLEISPLYLPLLHVQTIAAGLQVLFLSILTVYFYLDRRRVVLALTGGFVLANAGLTAASLSLGPAFFGYGFALALLIVVIAGFVSLQRSFSRLEYSTFMLQ